MTPLTAAEKKNCTGIKKLSKAFIACKTGNFRTGVINTGSSIKKNTIGKLKKTNNIEKKPSEIKKTEVVKKKVKKIDKKKITKKKSVASTEKIKASTVKLKIFLKNFKKSTKQYPKGTQK
tara:strand:+ start:67 stop:426 length:360 start_codon:yes stop_codon:yes gene_type:complete